MCCLGSTMWYFGFRRKIIFSWENNIFEAIFSMFFQEEKLKTCFAFYFLGLEIGQNDSEIPDLEFENHDEKIERRNERKTKKDEKAERRKDRKTKRYKDEKTERRNDRKTKRQKDEKTERRKSRKVKRQKDEMTERRKDSRQKPKNMI